MKLTPGIRPLMASIPSFGNNKYKLMLNKMYETIRKIRILTYLLFD